MSGISHNIMQAKKSIDKYNFELKISILFVIVWAGWMYQARQQRPTIAEKHVEETLQKTQHYPVMAAAKKI